MNKWEIVEWVHRIFCFTIFQSLINIVGFGGLYYSIQVLETSNNLSFAVRVGIVQCSLAIAYLQITNFFYWLFEINLFDLKKLWGVEVK